MEGSNWGEFEKYKCKSENRSNKIFIRLQKAFAKAKKHLRNEKAKNEQKNLKIQAISLIK